MKFQDDPSSIEKSTTAAAVMPCRFRRFRIRDCRPRFAEIESESHGYAAGGAPAVVPVPGNRRRANGNLDP